MPEMLMAEVYAGQAVGEPVRTISGTEARLREKAALLAVALGQPVEVVVAGGVQRWRVTPCGRPSVTGGGDD